MELTPYVPRLVLEWGRDTPDARYRRLGGSLAFCDLSGFTAMSEKLAVLGRLGAEELADVLNLLFSALLADAAAYGGGLLKYGGDAVLLFFQGDDHAARAAAATHRMRATLRRVGTVKTSRGTVRVRMSVGVHSGEFDFFLVGDSHHELIVAGPGATTTVDMEGAADAGEILLSPDTAAALAPSCVGASKGGGFLLKRVPRAEARDPAAWGVPPEIDPAPFIPVGLRPYVGGVGTDAEHRHIAVGFVAFGGVDALLAHEGGERVALVLDEFIAACQSAFARYDVCFLYADVYGDGGKVFFLAGAPVSHEDNEERVLRAALEISAGVHEPLHLHTGLNRGYVFAGDIGAKFRRTYTVLGDAVNTAARVMASCTEDNQVRAMPEVLDLASSRFEAEPQAPFAAKGKALPLETLAVGRPIGPRLSDTRLPLVGRQNELAELTDHLERARAGHGGFIRVSGPAGIGKSRLVDELRQVAEDSGFATVTTFAEQYEQSTVWFVLRQLLSVVFEDAHDNPAALLARAESLAPTEARWFPLLGPVFGLEIAHTPESRSVDAESAPTMLGRLTLHLLDGFLAGPALWVAENGHFVDEASAKAIAAVSADLGHRPWLIVGVGRDDEARGLSDPAADSITVGPLSRDDSIELVRAASPSMLHHDAATIAERADGNPLFVRQLVTAKLDGAELADSVETAIAARIDRLPSADRDVLRTAAVLGGRVDLGALRELLDGRVPDLGPLHDFVTIVDGEAVFRQALYREVAYEGLTFRRRRALHLAAGRLLETEVDGDNGPFERLSLHFHHAQAWTQSWEYSGRAGERAVRTTAKSVAATFFERALNAGRRLPEVSGAEVGDVAAKLGRALFNAGRHVEARAACRVGRRISPKDTPTRANLDLCEAVLEYQLGRFRTATQWFRRGLSALEASGADLTKMPSADTATSLFVGLADIYFREGRIDEARALATRATEAAIACDEPVALSKVHNLNFLIALFTGDLDAALIQGRAALEASRRDERFLGTIATNAMNLGAILQEVGDWTGAAALFAEALAATLQRGNDSEAAVTQVNMAEVFIDQGRWDEASAMLDACTPIVEQTDPEATMYAGVLRALLELRSNGCDTPKPPEIQQDFRFGALVYGMRVEAALASGDLDAATRALAEADAAGETPGLRPVLGAAVEAARDPSSALSAVQGALAQCREADSAFGAVLAKVMLGGDLELDEDATRLGIVDVPHWVKRIARIAESRAT